MRKLPLIAIFATKYAAYALAQTANLLQMRRCLSGILSQTFKPGPSAGLFSARHKPFGVPGFFLPGANPAACLAFSGLRRRGPPDACHLACAAP